MHQTNPSTVCDDDPITTNPPPDATAAVTADEDDSTCSNSSKPNQRFKHFGSRFVLRPLSMLLRNAELLIWTLLFLFVVFVLVRHRAPPAQSQPWNKLPVHRGMDHETRIRREALGLDAPRHFRARNDDSEATAKHHTDLGWHGDRDFLDQHELDGSSDSDAGGRAREVDVNHNPDAEWWTKKDPSQRRFAWESSSSTSGSTVDGYDGVLGGNAQRDNNAADGYGGDAATFNDDVAMDGDEPYPYSSWTDPPRRPPPTPPPLTLRDIKRHIRRLEMNEEFSLVQLRLKELEELKKQRQRLMDEYDFADEQDAFREKEREWQRIKWSEQEKKLQRWVLRARQQGHEEDQLRALGPAGAPESGGMAASTTLDDLDARRCPGMHPTHPFVPYAQHLQSIPDPTYAYVTYVSSAEFVPAAATLLHSIAVSGSQYARAICITADVSQRDRDTLSLLGQLILIDKVPSPRYIDNPRYRETFTKLRIWQLAMFRRILYIDTDVVVTRNMDDLFDLHEWAVPMDAEQNRYSTGMMVCEPSLATFDQMMADLQTTTTSMELPDLLFLKSYFDSHQKKVSIIPRWYQVYQEEFGSQYQTYLTNRKQKLTVFDSRIHGIHYPGAGKPWGNYAMKLAKYKPHFCHWQDADVFQYEPQFLWYVHHELMLRSLARAKNSNLFDFEHGGEVIALTAWAEAKKKSDAEESSWRGAGWRNNNNNNWNNNWGNNNNNNNKNFYSPPTPPTATTAASANAFEWAFRDGKWIKIPKGGAGGTSSTSAASSNAAAAVSDPSQAWRMVPGSCRFVLTEDLPKTLRPWASPDTTQSAVPTEVKVPRRAIHEDDAASSEGGSGADILQGSATPQALPSTDFWGKPQHPKQQPVDANNEDAASNDDLLLQGDGSSSSSSNRANYDSSSGRMMPEDSSVGDASDDNQPAYVHEMPDASSSGDGNGIVDGSSSSSSDVEAAVHDAAATHNAQRQSDDGLPDVLQQGDGIDEDVEVMSTTTTPRPSRKAAVRDSRAPRSSLPANRKATTPRQSRRALLPPTTSDDGSAASSNSSSSDDGEDDMRRDKENAMREALRRPAGKVYRETYARGRNPFPQRQLHGVAANDAVPGRRRRATGAINNDASIPPAYKDSVERVLRRKQKAPLQQDPSPPPLLQGSDDVEDGGEVVTSAPLNRRPRRKVTAPRATQEEVQYDTFTAERKHPNRRAYAGVDPAPTLPRRRSRNDGSNSPATMPEDAVDPTHALASSRRTRNTEQPRRRASPIQPLVNRQEPAEGAEDDDILGAPSVPNDGRPQRKRDNSSPIQSLRQTQRPEDTANPDSFSADGLDNAGEVEVTTVPLGQLKVRNSAQARGVPTTMLQPTTAQGQRAQSSNARVLRSPTSAAVDGNDQAGTLPSSSSASDTSGSAASGDSEHKFMALLNALIEHEAAANREKHGTQHRGRRGLADAPTNDDASTRSITATSGLDDDVLGTLGPPNRQPSKNTGTRPAAAPTPTTAPSEAVPGASIDFSMVPPLILTLPQAWAPSPSVETYEWVISWCTKTTLRPPKTEKCGKPAHVSQYSSGLCRTNFDESFEVLPIYARRPAAVGTSSPPSAALEDERRLEEQLIEPLPLHLRRSRKQGATLGIAGVVFRSKVTLDTPLRAKWFEVVVRCDPSMEPHEADLDGNGTTTNGPVVVVNNTHPPHGRTYRVRLRSRCACLGGCDSFVNGSMIEALFNETVKGTAATTTTVAPRAGMLRPWHSSAAASGAAASPPMRNATLRYIARAFRRWQAKALGPNTTTMEDFCHGFGRDVEACLASAEPRCEYDLTSKRCGPPRTRWIKLRGYEAHEYANCTHVGGDAERARTDPEQCQKEALAAGANVVNYVNHVTAATTTSPPPTVRSYQRQPPPPPRVINNAADAKKTTSGCFYKKCPLGMLYSGKIPMAPYVPGGPTDGLLGFDVYALNPFADEGEDALPTEGGQGTTAASSTTTTTSPKQRQYRSWAVPSAPPTQPLHSFAPQLAEPEEED